MVKSRSVIAIPPGATIKEQLTDRGMTQKEFAIRMDMSEKHISRLINGSVQLTTDMAVRLETVLGVPAAFWCNLEAVYREKLVRAKAENEMDVDVEIADKFPYEEMAGYDWVPKTDNMKERVHHLREYFEVVRLELLQNPMVNPVACCTQTAVVDKYSSLAWIQKAKLEGRNVLTEVLNIQGLYNLLPEIYDMKRQNPESLCRILTERLAGQGVTLVFLPPLKNCSLQGVSFRDGKRIVMGLLDYEQNKERFWFCFLHELAHIIYGHIDKAGGISDEDEEEANRFANNF
ncbi:MAG: HigA family addiction module antitoxin [Clostridiales bacterium]|nr:HigA family addiction module antitoxin [Clostridiales bacterium]